MQALYQRLGLESWKCKPQSERTEASLASSVLAFALVYAVPNAEADSRADEVVRYAKERFSYLFATADR